MIGDRTGCSSDRSGSDTHTIDFFFFSFLFFFFFISSPEDIFSLLLERVKEGRVEGERARERETRERNID